MQINSDGVNLITYHSINPTKQIPLENSHGVFSNGINLLTINQKQ